MKNTKFLFFKKPDTTDVVGPEDFNDNSDKIDEILYNSARIEEAGGTANAITLKSVTLENGAIKNFIATSNNNSAATTINGKNVYRAGTTEPPTFMEKKAYCIWYNSIGDNFFTKANAEGDVDASEVLAGKYFSNDKDTHIKGTMPNNPSINAALNCSDSINIPKGYTPGGVVKANSLASQTSATAEDNKVLKGYTYWKDGVRRTGNIELLQTQTITPGTSNKIIAPGKYINGNQIIKGDANLISSNIIKGKSIFGVNGSVIQFGSNDYHVDVRKVTFDYVTTSWVQIDLGHNSNFLITIPTPDSTYISFRGSINSISLNFTTESNTGCYIRELNSTGFLYGNAKTNYTIGAGFTYNNQLIVISIYK